MNTKPTVMWIAVPRPPDVGPATEVVVSLVACLRSPPGDERGPLGAALSCWPKFLYEHLTCLRVRFSEKPDAIACETLNSKDCESSSGPETDSDGVTFRFSRKDVEDILKAQDRKLWDAMVAGLTGEGCGVGAAKTATSTTVREATKLASVPPLGSFRPHTYPARRVTDHLLRERAEESADRLTRLHTASAFGPLLRANQRADAEQEFWDNLVWEVPSTSPSPTPAGRAAERRLYRASVDPYGDRPGPTEDQQRYSLREEVRQHIESGGIVAGFAAAGDGPGVLGDFVDLATFHRRTRADISEKDPTRAAEVSEGPSAAAAPAPSSGVSETPNFDERLTTLKTYPGLLRPLGLVIDLRLPVDDAFLKAWHRSEGDKPLRYVSACVDFDVDEIAPDPAAPVRTAYVLSRDGRRFAAQDGPSGARAAVSDRMDWLAVGYARLDDGDPRTPSAFSLTTLDHVGAGLSTLSGAASQRDLPTRILFNGDTPVAMFAGRPSLPLASTFDQPRDRREAAGALGQAFAAWWRRATEVSRCEVLRRWTDAPPSSAVPLTLGDGTRVRVRIGAPNEGCPGEAFSCVHVSAEGDAMASPPEPELPAFHGAGLVLHRDASAAELLAEIKAMEDLRRAASAEPGTAVLYGRDLVSGLVPFVWARNPACATQAGWFSVGRRRERIPSGLASGLRAETVLRLPTPFVPHDSVGSGSVPEEVSVAETVFQYAGHHLGAPDAPPEPWCPVSLTEWPASLPPLRFAPAVPREKQERLFAYRVALATVDMAGHFVTPDQREPSDKTESKSAVLRRHEPVQPPVLVATPRTGDAAPEGRSISRLVVTGGSAESERWVVPPRVSREFAEMHGRLDAPSLSAIGGMDALELEYVGNSPLWPSRYVPSGTTASTQSAAGGESPSGETWRVTWPRRGPPPGDGCPFYYPDPLAAGFRLVAMPVGKHERSAPVEEIVGWYDRRKWPHASPWRLRVRSAAHGRALELRKLARSRVLLLVVPAAWEIEIRLSSALALTAENDFPLMPFDLYAGTYRCTPTASRPARARSHARSASATLKPFRSRVEAPEAHDLARSVAATAAARAESSAVEDMLFGRNPVLTPPTSLTAVHATAFPLHAPTLDAPDEVSNVSGGTEHDATDAAFEARVSADTKSTDKVEVHASWSEPLDDPAAAGPGRRDQQDFVDAYAVDAICSTDPTKPRIAVLHHLGRTKHLLVDYRAHGRGRYVKDLAATGQQEPSATLAGPTTRVRVLNRRNPERPCVAYALPTLRWRSAREDVPAPPFYQFRSTRSGDVVRILLERGWYSSGEGELLGVVLADPAKKKSLPPSEWGPSLWARDPLRVPRRRALPPLGPDQVWGFERMGQGLALPEHLRQAASAGAGGGNATSVVAGFRPTYDPTLGLWFVDVGLRGLREDGYVLPEDSLFVRLTLVRFQPHSVSGCELSEPVLLDYAQLGPERSLIVARDGSDLRGGTLLVRITAPLPVDRKKGLGHAGVRVRVVVPTVDVDGAEVGWQDDVHATITPGTARPERGLLWTGTVHVSDYRRPRRLLVEEQEGFVDHPERTQPYFDVLEL